jgi:hypothetical protein
VRLAYDTKLVLNTGPMLGWLYRLGQAPYNHQTPDGYPWTNPPGPARGRSTRFEIARAIGSGSAGLFRVEGEKSDKPAFPQLANPLYYEGIAPRLAPPPADAPIRPARPRNGPPSCCLPRVHAALRRSPGDLPCTAVSS